MYNTKELQEKFREVTEFSDVLEKFVLTNNQININESLINVYNKYDTNLRIIFKSLVQCEEKKENFCIKKFKDEYDNLRSDISKIIEKDLKN